MNASAELSNIRWFIDNWWLTLIRGIVAILFGVMTFIWPGITILSLTILWGAYALVDGVMAIVTAFSSSGAQTSSRWWLGLAGLVGIAAGVLTFLFPIGTSLGLLIFLAAWLVVAGVMQIIGAIRLRKVIDNEWLLGLVGALSILLGISLVAFPGSGLVSVAWMVGTFAIIAGISYIGLSMRLKKLANRA
jgi:uncharacterized membrane protein HdeD (DUF308 family)